MSTLSQLRDRVEQLLQDVSNDIFTTGLLDECLRQALDEYSQVSPLTMETVITLPGDGHEIALDSLPNLSEVLEVCYPYDTTGAAETCLPNQVRGFRLLWDDARAVLWLETLGGVQPQQGEQVRLWYAQPHTIQDLDGGDCTTLPTPHETMLVVGAAGHAALSRAIDLVEVAGTDLYAIGLLGAWGRAAQKRWYAFLESLRRQQARRGPAWGRGWNSSDR
jgi:hypothetical protein